VKVDQPARLERLVTPDQPERPVQRAHKEIPVRLEQSALLDQPARPE
jgi:hypothetical protein